MDSHDARVCISGTAIICWPMFLLGYFTDPILMHVASALAAGGLAWSMAMEWWYQRVTDGDPGTHPNAS